MGFLTFRLEALVREGLARAFYPQGTARQMAAVMAANFRVANLGSIHVPTVVFHGQKDPLVPPRSGSVIASQIPGARLVMLEEVSHDIPEEIYDVLVQELRDSAHSAGQIKDQ